MIASTQNRTGSSSIGLAPRQISRHFTPDTAIDDALVASFLGGSEKAFAEIIARHRDKIFNVTLSVIHNHADAEELTQDTFIRAHRGLAKFRGDSSLETWLHRIAFNLSRNRYWYWFRRRRHDSVSCDLPLSADNGDTFSDIVADVGQDPAQDTAANEFAGVVKQCIKRLDPHQREILTLRGIRNNSYSEIAKKIGVSVGTVKSRVSRARGSLKEILAEIHPEFAGDKNHNEWFVKSRNTYGGPTIACA
jgi:RNA polymerase sigma-70 factor (ECF subfamily)